MKIIIFNGPPSCGKDTASEILQNYLYETNDERTVIERRMSHPIKAAFAGTIDDEDFFLNRNHDGNYVGIHEPNKEDPIYPFGVSYRQWQIDFSEKFMKPLYGEAIFVKLFCDWLYSNPYPNVVLVPDCGFQIELDHLAAELRPHHSLMLVRIQREGCSFENDSRSYIRPRTIDIQCRDISNNSTLDDYRKILLSSILPWLNQ